MAILSVSGVPCGAPSNITLPLTGRPWSEVTLAATSVPWSTGDQVRLSIEGGMTYHMTVERLGASGGFLRARLICGTGGLGKEIDARYYSGASPSQVLKEILSDCGETAGEIELPDAPLPSWTRPAGPAHEALRALMMRYPDRTWRMTPEGKVEVRVPNWPPFEPELRIESEDPAAAIWTCEFAPSLTAGQHVTLSREGEALSKRATRVTHSISESYAYPRNQVHLRTMVSTGDGRDLGVSGLEATVQRAVRWVDYLALYDAEVLRDHGDHTLDLRPSNPLLPEMTRVRLVQPFPGAKLKLKAGGNVLLSFQAGDPARPVAVHHGLCQLERLEITTILGQQLIIDDDRGAVSPDDAVYQRPSITVRDAAGQQIELYAERGKERVTVQDAHGQVIEMQKNGMTIISPVSVSISAPVVNIDGDVVNLAGGGPAVARVGDLVDPTTNRIISGSSKVGSG